MAMIMNGKIGSTPSSAWQRQLQDFLGIKSVGKVVNTALIGGILIGTLSTGTPAAAAEGFVPIEQGRLYYVDEGSKGSVPLIVINGGPGFSHTYMTASPVWADLAKNRRVILYDQRGTGKSSSSLPSARNTLELQAHDLEALRKHLEAEKIDIIGHSFGGLVGMRYAMMHGSKVEHLVVIGSGSPKPSEHEFLFESMFPDIVYSQSLESRSDETGCESDIEDADRMSYYDVRNRPRRSSNANSTPSINPFSMEICKAVMEDLLKLDLFPALAGIRVPTLVMNGRFDANTSVRVSYKISQSIPGAKLAIFERSGHSPFQEEPAKFLLDVERFLDNKYDSID